MFKDCTIDWSQVDVTGDDGTSEGDGTSPTTTSGSRKRQSSGATTSTADSPSKKNKRPKAAMPKKEKLKVTSLLQEMFLEMKKPGVQAKLVQNVLAICDFDGRFTFVAAGIPGSAHDWTVLQEVMFRHNDKFPHPPPGTGPWGCIGFHISVINWYICFVTYGKFCRQVLPGGLGIPEPAGISTTLQGSEVPCR